MKRNDGAERPSSDEPQAGHHRWLIRPLRRRLRRLGQMPLMVEVLATLPMVGFAVVHIASAVSQRLGTAVMQPLVAGHAVNAAAANGLGSLWALGFYGVLMSFRRVRRLDTAPIRSLTSRRELLCLVGFPLFFGGANLVAMQYSALLYLGTGNAITSTGPITLSLTMSLAILLRGNRGDEHRVTVLDLALPVMSLAGALLMIPWGHPIDLFGVLYALVGAVCAAGMSYTGKTLSDAGVGLRTQGLGLSMGVVFGAWGVLHIDHWTADLLVRSLITGAFIVVGAFGYAWAQAPHRLTKRLVSALGGNGPALSSAVGWAVLKQPIRPLATVGMLMLINSSVVNALQHGRKAAQARK